jgi:hypothetical protein
MISHRIPLRACQHCNRRVPSQILEARLKEQIHTRLYVQIGYLVVVYQTQIVITGMLLVFVTIASQLG